MKANIRNSIAVAGAIAVSTVVITLALDATPRAPRSAVAERIERGRYLVNQVGLCIDCHSPRNEHGEPSADQHLTGAPIGFRPLVDMPWMSFAPRLAGLPVGFTEAEFVDFLMTGERPNGRPGTLPPMPPYRMNREDAEAVAAYLSSLPAADPTP